MPMAQTPPISDSRDKSERSPKEQTPGWLYKRVGRYQLQALLGGGSNGRVFRAEDLQLARQVALKVFSLSSNQDTHAQTIGQAIREAKLAAGLDHPHIIHIYEVNETPTLCYIAMELVEGGSLKDLVRGGGPMEFRRACQIMAEIAEALAFAHERGVIHRDVKPANLMLSGGGRCKLADFGLAILNSRFSDKSASGIAGTPQFIAPELIKGEPASPQSDIYSLGATLWFLLTASPPFSADSVPELLDKQLNDPLPKLTRLRPDVPDTLVRAISKAMEKDPASRYENAEQFASVLRIHTIPVGGTASSLANLGGLLPPSKPVPVRRAILLGGMAAMICVAIMAIPVYWLANGWLRPTNHSTHVTSDYSLSPRPLVATSPEKTPVKVPSSQPAPAIAPGKIFQATDTAMLKQLASSLASADDSAAPAQVVVEGVVTSNHPSKRAKYFRIGFSDDNDDNNNDFGCIYRPELLPALQAKFGSADGLGLTGKRIRVTGHLEMFKERPAIKIDASDQIEIVK